MFPNIRLMIVAVLASILGISCALGLFAEFRVSHDSFLRESNANAPMQLSANDAAPARVMNTAVPFEFRFQAPPAAAETAGRTVISEPVAAVEPAPVAPVVTPMVAAAPETAAPQNTQQDGKPGTTDDVAARTPAAAAPLGDPDALSKIVPERANPAAPSRSARTTRRHRPLVVRRLQRSRPASGQTARQGLTGTQPGYQWAAPSGSGAPQTVHRRVIVRRARPAKQQARQPVAASTTPQTAVSNTPPVHPPE
jgi:hypothetical protein